MAVTFNCAMRWSLVDVGVNPLALVRGKGTSRRQVEPRILDAKEIKLSVWWLRLGISTKRIRPGHPQQNGRHERMHLTLKKEVTRPPGANICRSKPSSTPSWTSSIKNDA